jgi:hypothetical protein
VSSTDLKALSRYFLALAARSVIRLDDGAGLPAATAGEVKVGRSLAAIGSIAFALAAVWEIAAPFGAGHYAASASVALGGENMLRFHTLLPIVDQPLGAPTTDDCYCHHPFGIFWTAALFAAAFGHHALVCRLPAVLLSIATPPVLYALGRALFGPLAGAVAALAFVSTPIALSYANFNALEVPVIFGTLLASLGYVRLRQSGRRRWLFVTVGALVYAVNSDWPAFVFAAGLLGLVFLRTFVFGKGLEALQFRRSAQLFAWGTALTAAVGVGYALLLVHIGKLDELLAQGHARAEGAQRALSEILEARRYWLLLMFTPLAIVVGKLATPLITARALLAKSELEALPLALLGMALFQYLVFAQGADVHVFWPHYFAPYFALALAALAATLGALGSRLFERKSGLWPRVAAFSPRAAALFALVVPLLMARDAFTTLVYARKTGGRFNERGRFIQPDKDKVAALSYLSEHSPPDAVVALDANMRRSLWVPWVLGRATKVPGDPSRGDERYYVVDGRFTNDGTLRANAAAASTTVVGPFWIFDRKARGPAQAFAVQRREPSLLERYFVSSNHALRSVTRDPFWTWEVREHLLQTPNELPKVEPRGFEQLRISYNMALHSGDWERAKQIRAELMKGVDCRCETLYQDGTRLLGVRYEAGTSDVLTAYFESVGAADQRFTIHSRVEARLPWSLVPADTLRWEVGLPTTLPREVWKPGYLYSSVTELLRRPGRERFTGAWVNTGRELPLLTKNGTSDVSLLVLP